FFRNHLTHGYPKTRTHVNLTGVNRDGTVHMDGEKTVDFTRIERFSEVRGLCCACLGLTAIEGETHDNGTGGSEKITSLHRFHAFLLSFRRAEDRGENASVGCAPAEIASERLFDIFGCGMRFLSKKRFRSHNHSIRA